MASPSRSDCCVLEIFGESVGLLITEENGFVFHAASAKAWPLDRRVRAQTGRRACHSGAAVAGGYGTPLPGSSQFTLTMPSNPLKNKSRGYVPRLFTDPSTFDNSESDPISLDTELA